MNRVVYIFVLFALLFSACSEDDEGTNMQLSTGQEYYPIYIGQESVFQIDSIQYDDFTGRVDTLRHQRRELVEEQLTDGENRLAYNVGVYTRANDTSNWRKVKVIRRTLTDRRLEVLEENVVRIDLVFPVADGVEWNPNALNANNEEEYVYANVNMPFQLNGSNYDSTITVQQEDRENLIERMFAEEKYARGMGLIYRRSIDVRTDFMSGEIESGFDVRIRLISFR